MAQRVCSDGNGADTYQSRCWFSGTRPRPSVGLHAQVQGRHRSPGLQQPTVHKGGNAPKETVVLYQCVRGYLPPSRSPPPPDGAGAGAGALSPPNKSSPPNCKVSRVCLNQPPVKAYGDQVASLAEPQRTIIVGQLTHCPAGHDVDDGYV